MEDGNLNVPWTLALRTFGGDLITYADCAGLSSSMAYGILQARALPRDVKAAPTDANDLISEIAQYLVLVIVFLSCCHVSF